MLNVPLLLRCPVVGWFCFIFTRLILKSKAWVSASVGWMDGAGGQGMVQLFHYRGHILTFLALGRIEFFPPEIFINCPWNQARDVHKTEPRRFSFFYSPACGTDSQLKAHSYARRQQHLNSFFSSRDHSLQASLPATLTWSLAYTNSRAAAPWCSNSGVYSGCRCPMYVQIHQDGILLPCTLNCGDNHGFKLNIQKGSEALGFTVQHSSLWGTNWFIYSENSLNKGNCCFSCWFEYFRDPPQAHVMFVHVSSGCCLSLSTCLISYDK